MDEAITETAGKAFEYWGAFGFVVLILLAVIAWLLKHNKSQRDNFQKVIDDQKEAYQKVIDEQNKERRYWVDTAFKTARESSDQVSRAFQQVSDIVKYLEKN